jgi:hypothetical protein
MSGEFADKILASCLASRLVHGDAVFGWTLMGRKVPLRSRGGISQRLRRWPQRGHCASDA